ncbi:MAG TPA: hypothetical protein ENF93_01565, partial [Ignisphaera sp.]|nr:hypothetical protein [Ignisphaera sp.]
MVTQIRGDISITIESTGIAATRSIEASERSTIESKKISWSTIKNEILELLRSRRAIDESSAITIDEIIEDIQLSRETYQECIRAIAIYGIREFKRRLALILGSLVRSRRLDK